MPKTYLGDAVYADVDDLGDLILTTENGTRRATNRIVLEPVVVSALLSYVERWRAEVLERARQEEASDA